MLFLSLRRRARRASEWSQAKAVTFIVTLAATQSVTLAARAAGMSRKSAYALKGRDPAFASSWEAALNVRKGDKVEEVEGPPIPSSEGDKPARAALPVSSTADAQSRLRLETLRRDRFFERLAKRRANSPQLAPKAPAQ